VFEGLAGPAQVWLNGELRLEARNQFRPHSFEATLGERNELRIRFSSLRSELARKRPRPRWKTALVANQNLRFLRVSLVGRIPAWCPPLPAIGLVGEVRIEDLVEAKCQEIRLVPSWSASLGATLTVEARLALPPGVRDLSASIRVGEQTLPLELAGDRITGALRIPGLSPWWPTTHGEPALYRTELEIQTSAGAFKTSTGSLGFRSVELAGETSAGVPRGGIQFKINGVPVFLRGACWTGTAEGSPDSLRELLLTARDGGLNLIRVGGTMPPRQRGELTRAGRSER
jgi:beta-mannosidase